MSIFGKVGRVITAPVRVAKSAVERIGAAVSILGWVTGKRTQRLLLVLGMIVAIVQPVIAQYLPEYNDLVVQVMKVLGVAAGMTFAEKVQRLLELIKNSEPK